MSREEWLSIIPRRGGRSENDSAIFKCERPPRRQASASEHYDVLDAQLARNLYYADDHPEIVRGDAEFLRLQEAGGDVWIDPNHPRPRFIKAMDERIIRPRDLNEVLKQMIEWVESYACRWMKKRGLQQAGEDRIGEVVSYVVHQLLGIPRAKKNHRQPVQNKQNNELIQLLKDIDDLLRIADQKTQKIRMACINSVACSPLKEHLKDILRIEDDIQTLDIDIDYLGVFMSDPCKNNTDLEQKLPKAKVDEYNDMRKQIAEQGFALKDATEEDGEPTNIKVKIRQLREKIKFYKMLIEQWELKQVRILEAMEKQVQEREETKGSFGVPEVTELNDSKDSEVADGRSPLEMLVDVAAQAEPLENINTIPLDMATVVSNSLPALPQGWSADKDFKPIGKLSPATQRSIEPVGPHFLAHARRARHKRTFSEDDRIQAQENVKKVEEEDDGEISEPEDPMMLSRDAKDWKGQDHYAVLGLSKYRYKATEDQIKRAHRKKVLRHHPDKKAAAGSSEDDSFFKCIQKAHETLTDPVKRRQFDSVDEHADVEPPSKKVAKGTKFYSLWSKVFESEGRFSKNQPVPKFGKIDSTQEEVEAFYNFFYTFDSWRSFEYQDEDVPDDNEGRDQKRHTERKNNNARKKKKTEDSARLRKLVEDAQAGDERIARFRQEANAAKNKKKLDKEAREKKAAEEAQAKKDAEAQAKKDAEEKAKADKEGNKKAREAAKAAVKKNRRVLKSSVKDANYFVKGDPAPAAIDSVLNEVDIVQGKVDPDEIAALAGKLNGLKVADEIKSVWADEVKRLVAAGKVKDGELKSLA